MPEKINQKDGDRFDWFPILDEEFVHSLVNKVLANITSKDSARGITKEHRISRDKDRKLVAQHLISALYGAYCTINRDNSNVVVSVIRDANFYSSSPTKDPNKIKHSWRCFDAVYDSLIEMDWINVNVGMEGKGYTRIYPINELRNTFEEIGIRWCKQQPININDLIVLRDKDDDGKKFDLPTPDTNEVKVMASRLYKYNSFLTKHCIALDVDDEQLYEISRVIADNKDNEKKERLQKLYIPRVQLKRIFSRGDMELGGRFYHGWWQSVPSLYRPQITIDNCKTSEVDFSTMSLRIIYAICDCKAPDAGVDLYDIGLDGWQGPKDPRRKPIKRYINALMNDYKGTFRLEQENLEIIGMKQKGLKDKVLDVHHEIAEYLEAGVGLQTQFIDSQIADDVMHTLMHEGIVLLPIHDSFIIRTGYEASLENAMQAAFMRQVKANISVDADGSRLPTQFGMNDEQMALQEQMKSTRPGSFIVNGADIDFDDLTKSSIMSRYTSSWER